jgi:hypothetical protein
VRLGLGPQAHRVADDHPLTFQFVDAVLHGRARDAQRLCQRRHRRAGVVAQERNQLLIGGIHGGGQIRQSDSAKRFGKAIRHSAMQLWQFEQ